MTQEARSLRLLEATRSAVHGADAAAAALGDAPDVRPGDLFVHPATAAWPVEWLLVRLDGPRCQVVPADTFTAARGSDVTVTADDPAGPLTLRGEHATWVDAGALRPERRTGRVGPDLVERVRFLVGARTSPASSASDPELDEWRAALDAACAALAAAAPPVERRPGGRLTPRLLGLAASVLLVSTVILGGRMARLSRTVDRLERDRAATTAALERAEGARRSAAARADQLRAQLAAADEAHTRDTQPPAPRSLVNVPFLWLTPDEAVRGEMPALTLPPEGELVVLIVPLVEPRRFARYRVELARSGEVVWQSSDLVPTGVAELSLALPRSLLPPGRYRLQVSGVGGRTERLATFRFSVATAPASSAAAQRQSP
jgi:hypothetical protein